ncbi:MAG: hypothetical protein L0H53_09630, partial [Candidatus Nitrosocosmicus sp.]|nr:hypothetical protein [Candidatus Nitrosocosmicus sp.]
MSSYGSVGVSPLAPMANTPEHELATLLKDNYDQTITGIPLSDINFEQWWSGYRDVAVYFQDTGSFNVGNNLGHRIEDIDSYTDIHIFARSIKSDYASSGEKKCFDIEKWIRKVIQQHNTDL